MANTIQSTPPFTALTARKPAAASAEIRDDYSGSAADHWEQEKARTREMFAQLNQHIAAGETEFQVGANQIQVESVHPGYVRVKSWDRSPNTGWSTEGFEVFQRDGVSMLGYSRYSPGSASCNDRVPENVCREMIL